MFLCVRSRRRLTDEIFEIPDNWDYEDEGLHKLPAPFLLQSRSDTVWCGIRSTNCNDEYCHKCDRQLNSPFPLSETTFC